MPIYRYSAMGPNGVWRQGSIEAESRADAEETLRMAGVAGARITLPHASCDHRVPDVQTEQDVAHA